MEPSYRVVFRGDLRPGFELSAVKQAAEVRLKAPAAMLAQLFSGRRVILKKGISQEIGQRYLAELENLGMQAFLEAEATEPPAIADAPPTPAVTPPAVAPSPVAGSDMKLNLAPALDPAYPQDLSAYAPPTEIVSLGSRHAGAEATVFVHRNTALDEDLLKLAEAASAPIPGLPPRAAAEPPPAHAIPPAEPTVFVPRDAKMIRQMLDTPAPEPTVFVPKPGGQTTTSDLPPAEATVFVPRSKPSAPRRSFDSERTLIASAETLAEYFSATNPVQNPDEPSLLEDSGATAARPEPISEPRPRSSSDSTVLAAALPASPKRRSNDTTVYVAPKEVELAKPAPAPAATPASPAPKKPRPRPVVEPEDDWVEEPEKTGKGRAVVLIVLLAAAAAGAYYYYFMQ